MTLIQLTAPCDGAYRLDGHVTIFDRGKEDA